MLIYDSSNSKQIVKKQGSYHGKKVNREFLNDKLVERNSNLWVSTYLLILLLVTILVLFVQKSSFTYFSTYQSIILQAVGNAIRSNNK